MLKQVVRLHSAQLLSGSLQNAAIFSMDALINAADLHPCTNPTECVVVCQCLARMENASTGSHDM